MTIYAKRVIFYLFWQFLLQGFILGGDKFFALGGYREKPTEDLGQSKEACYAWETGLIDK